jgi:hypothetical protein
MLLGSELVRILMTDAPSLRPWRGIKFIMPAQRRSAALDTPFLLALAGGDDNCAEIIDWLSRINVYPLVTGTVLQELMDAEQNDLDPFVKQNAESALMNLTTWGVLDTALSPTDNGVAKIIAGKFVEKGVLPDEHENDGLVVAEAALHDCKMLITYRETLLNAPLEGIKFMLIESDVPALFIVSPDNIIEYLRKTEEATSASAKS